MPMELHGLLWGLSWHVLSPESLGSISTSISISISISIRTIIEAVCRWSAVALNAGSFLYPFDEVALNSTYPQLYS